MIQDENRTTHYIPENYSTGINVGGMNFKVRNFVEGIILGIITGSLSILILFYVSFIDAGTKIGIVISFALIGLVIGIVGINDEPISVFVSNKLSFDRRKRTAFYNPHIKGDAIPYIYEYQENRENLPREKIIAFYKKYKADIEKREQEKMREFQSTNTFDETSMFFEDDEGFFAKPVEFMNDSEYRRYQKDLKRKARKERREQKKAEKLALKEEKKARRLAAKEEKARAKLEKLEAKRLKQEEKKGGDDRG